MSELDRQVRPQDDWKQKYLDSLERLESQEKHWEQVEALLRRSISRLTLAADGLNPELDRQLEQLRNRVRSEKRLDDLQQRVERIVDRAAGLPRAKRSDEGTEVTALLGDVIDAVNWPHGLARQAKRLRKRLAKAGPADLPQLVEPLQAFHAEALARARAEGSEAGGASEPGGLLRGLFRRGGGGAAPADAQPESTAEAPDDAADALHAPLAVLRMLLDRLGTQDVYQDDVARLRRQAAAVSTRQALVELVEAIADLRTPADQSTEPHSARPDYGAHEVLIQLIERLELPSEFNDRVAALKHSWEQGIEAQDLPRAVVAIAELVSDMRQRIEQEKNDIESFLKQLTERLQELDLHLQDNVASQRLALQSGRELDDAVQDQVRGIETSVREADDIDVLKQSVQQRLETLSRHMADYRSSEEQRNEAMERQVEQLTKKLHMLESETDELRKRMREKHEQALRDPLTGLPNRIAYLERIDQEYQRWKRYQTPLSLVVWDVDNFKRINDTYGHKAGDKVLCTLARVMQDQLRECDLLVRFGGEEFVIILPETTPEDAGHAAEKLRTAVEACAFHFKGKPVCVTVSGGIAHFSDNDDPDAVFERADQRMYQAKQSGKNRICAD